MNEKERQMGQDVLFEALLTGSSEGLIERQEAREQAIACGDGTRVQIGLECMTPSGKETLEQFGVQFTGEHDGVLQKVVLPEGWKLKPTSHSMWSDLVDDKGRVRAACFYKGAFYDRVAHYSVEFRYSPDVEYKDYGTYADGEPNCRATVKDRATGERLVTCEWKTYADGKADRQACRAWLDEHHPAWTHPAAYWERA